MPTANKSEKIFIGIDDQVVELTGVDKEAFIAQREADNAAHLLLETEYKKAFIKKNQGIKLKGDIINI